MISDHLCVISDHNTNGRAGVPHPSADTTHVAGAPSFAHFAKGGRDTAGTISSSCRAAYSVTTVP